MKKDNGFTLIEVIIALAIITSVSFIGYQVINKTHTLSKDQALTADIQNGVNNLKRYMTNELSSAKEVKLSYEKNKYENIKDIDKDNKAYENIKKKIDSISGDDIFSYKYLININDEKNVEYIVNIYMKNYKKLYSIDRLDKKTKMNFITNQALGEDKIPLEILFDKDLYNVNISYIKQNTELYSFDVYNRLYSFNNDSIKPIEPDNPIIVDNYFEYCISQSLKNLNDSELGNKEVSQIIESLNSVLTKDINLNQESMKETMEGLQNDLLYIIKSDTNILKDSYDNLNKALYYMYTAEETLDEINENQDIDKAKAISNNIHNGIYDDEENEGGKNTFVIQLNEFTDAIKHHANGMSKDDIDFATKLSEQVKSNLDSMWKYVNRTAGSEIFNIIHGSWNTGLTDENKKIICTTMNTVIDKVIDSKVYVNKVIREDILKEGNSAEVNKKGQKVNDELDDLIDALIEIKARIESSNYYVNQ